MASGGCLRNGRASRGSLRLCPGMLRSALGTPRFPSTELRAVSNAGVWGSALARQMGLDLWLCSSEPG